MIGGPALDFSRTWEGFPTLKKEAFSNICNKLILCIINFVSGFFFFFRESYE